MLDKILALARRLAEQAEVYEVIQESTPVVFEANRLKELQTKQSHGIGLRVVKNGRIGLASTTDFRNLSSLVEAAVASADFGAEARFELPSTISGTRVSVLDPALEALQPEQMIALGQTMIDRVHNYDPNILCGANISRAVDTVTIANSAGGRASYRKTTYRVYLEGNLTTGTTILDISEEAASCRQDIDSELLVSELTNKFDLSKQTATVPTKSMPVIFTPKAVASAFQLPIQIAFNGKMVLQGASPMGNKVGQAVLDPRVSIWDDGTLDYAIQSSEIDDEGTPTRRTPLVQGGVVQGFLYDLQTAGLAGATSTGNGFRGIASLPSPVFTSLIISEGDTLLPDMIRDVKEGLLVDQIMGAWAGNLLAGELSGNVHVGFKIENGILVGRVKDTMISGNLYEALGPGLAALGSERAWVEGTMFTPPMYFKAMSVATKQE